MYADMQQHIDGEVCLCKPAIALSPYGRNFAKQRRLNETAHLKGLCTVTHCEAASLTAASHLLWYVNTFLAQLLDKVGIFHLDYYVHIFFSCIRLLFAGRTPHRSLYG